METGQCLPAAQVRAALAAEGQSPIIVGNRSGYGYPTALIFTSNADGSKGYLIRGDKPFGEQAETACVDSVFTDIHLNDVTKPGIPAWALMDESADVADAECKRDHLGYQWTCRPYSLSVATRHANRQPVLFMATGSAINPPDKSRRNNQRILLTFSSEKQGGILSASTPNGASYLLAAYSSVQITQHAEHLIGRD